MAIDSKKDKVTKEEPLPPLKLRDNPEIQARIKAHKEANPEDAAFYTRLVKEHPERAADTLVWKDIQRQDMEVRLMSRQLRRAQAFYDAQSPEAKARIDADLSRQEETPRQRGFLSLFRRNRPQGAPGAEAGNVVQMPGQGAPKVTA